jgi:hypothetical protein
MMNTDTHDLIAGLHVPDLRAELGEELRHAWRVACDEALLAYRDWCAADADEAQEAYFTYLAAADREHAAALHLQRSAEARA